jgi:hypothetical protein
MALCAHSVYAESTAPNHSCVIPAATQPLRKALNNEVMQSIKELVRLDGGADIWML